MILSNRKLKLIIIALLLFIFATFLGMLSPKAYSYSGYLNSQTIVLTDDTTQVTYPIQIPNKNTQKLFRGLTNGFVTFSLSLGGQIEVRGITIYGTEGQKSACNIDSYLGYNDSDAQRPTISAMCYIDFFDSSRDWLSSIEINTYLMYGTKYITLGDTITYFVNEDPKIVQAIRDLQNAQAQNAQSINTINNNVSNINTSLNDSSIDNNQTSSDTSSWASMNASNGTITNLLTLPITLLQAIVNGLQTSCSSFSLGTLFNTNIVLPCINIGSLIGSGLWTTIDILFSGFMILAIAKKLIKIFNDFTNLKTNQMDEIYGGGSK